MEWEGTLVRKLNHLCCLDLTRAESLQTLVAVDARLSGYSDGCFCIYT